MPGLFVTYVPIVPQNQFRDKKGVKRKILTSDWFASAVQVKREDDVNILRLTPFSYTEISQKKITFVIDICYLLPHPSGLNAKMRPRRSHSGSVRIGR